MNTASPYLWVPGCMSNGYDGMHQIRVVNVAYDFDGGTVMYKCEQCLLLSTKLSSYWDDYWPVQWAVFDMTPRLVI